jgi:hypothetical protein
LEKSQKSESGFQKQAEGELKSCAGIKEVTTYAHSLAHGQWNANRSFRPRFQSSPRASFSTNPTSTRNLGSSRNHLDLDARDDIQDAFHSFNGLHSPARYPFSKYVWGGNHKQCGMTKTSLDVAVQTLMRSSYGFFTIACQLPHPNPHKSNKI